jgi:hypothetical protein
MSSARSIAIVAVVLAVLSSGARAARALDADAKGRAANRLGGLVAYDFLTGGARRWAPGAFLERRSTSWGSGASRLRQDVRAELDLSAAADTRADFARRLLLPGVFSMRWSGAVEHALGRGVLLRGPEVDVSAKAVARGPDATAQQLSAGGGVGATVGDAFDWSVEFQRAMNAPHASDRVAVASALGGPGLWATYLSTRAELRSPRQHVGVFGTFAAYLADSKFHVSPSGRRVFRVGLEALGRR